MGFFTKLKQGAALQDWARSKGANLKGAQLINQFALAGYNQCPQCRDFKAYVEAVKFEVEWSLGTYLYDLSDDWDREENEYAWQNIEEWQLNTAINNVNMAYLVGGPVKDKYKMTVKEYVKFIENQQNG